MDLLSVSVSSAPSLLAAASPCLRLAAYLRDPIDESLLGQFRTRVSQALEVFRGQCPDIGYALAAYLDELVAYSRWSEKHRWMSQPLQLELFDEHLAGEGFFMRLQLLRAKVRSDSPEASLPLSIRPESFETAAAQFSAHPEDQRPSRRPFAPPQGARIGQEKTQGGHGGGASRSGMAKDLPTIGTEVTLGPSGEDSSIDILELYFLILELGFRGKYRWRGEAEWREEEARLAHDIRLIREHRQASVPVTISDSADVSILTPTLVRRILWGCLGVVVIGYFAFSLALLDIGRVSTAQIQTLVSAWMKQKGVS